MDDPFVREHVPVPVEEEENDSDVWPDLENILSS